MSCQCVKRNPNLQILLSYSSTFKSEFIFTNWYDEEKKLDTSLYNLETKITRSYLKQFGGNLEAAFKQFLGRQRPSELKLLKIKLVHMPYPNV